MMLRWRLLEEQWTTTKSVELLDDDSDSCQTREFRGTDAIYELADDRIVITSRR